MIKKGAKQTAQQFHNWNEVKKKFGALETAIEAVDTSGIATNAAAISTNSSAISANTSALNTHKTSSDHDGRYYTESEIDTKLAALDAADIDTSTTNFDDVLSSADTDVQKALDTLNDLRDTLYRDNTSNNEDDMFTQVGQNSIAYAGTTVTFDTVFTSAPKVVISSQVRDWYATANTFTTTTFVGNVFGVGTKTCTWIAVGKKT